MNTKLLCIDSLEDYELVDDKLLQEYGIEVFYACKPSSTKAHSKHRLLINSFEYEALYSLCESITPDYIVCFSEDLFVDVANIRMKLKIKGMDLGKAMMLSHKNLMYEQLEGYFPYPKTTLLDETSSFRSITNELYAKELFIKPINMAGSYETYHIKNDSEFQKFLLNKKLHFKSYIAQTYIDADLYHSELVICNGEILFCSARKYSFPNHLMVSRNVPIFSLNINDSTQHKTIIDASIKVAELLGLNNGIFHTEFFMDNAGNVNFIETNARAPGIGLNRMYQNKLSISLETLLCFIVCGHNPPKFKEEKAVYICGYYPLKAGVVRAVVKPKLEVGSQWIFYVKPDDSSELMKHMSKSAMFICWDRCITNIENATRLLSNHNVVEVY